jgi:endogenous inhibitor of DNA gyrase (YacG/DUF329 family)
MTDATVKCPTCKRRGNWLEGKYAPFCSRRCQLIDLGKWFSEEHVVSEPLKPEHLSAGSDDSDSDSSGIASN